MITDHLGNKFKTQKAMYEHWGVPKNTFLKRKRKNWSLEKCLTYNDPKKPTPVKDHLGNTFPSKTEMFKYYNITPSAFYNRLKHNKTLQECLEKPKRNKSATSRIKQQKEKKKPLLFIDPINNKTKTAEELCCCHNIDYPIFNARLQYNHTVAEALGIVPLLNYWVRDKQINNNLYIIKGIKEKNTKRVFYFHCLLNDEETIMTRNEIVTCLLSEIKKEKQDATTGNKKSK